MPNNCASVILTLKSFTWYAFKRKILRILKAVHYLLTPWSSVLEKLTSLHLARNSPHFMEPEGSLPHSQVSTTRPYPQPARSSPHPHIPLPEDPSNIILPSKPGTSKWSLSIRFPHQNPMYASSLPPYALRAPPISLKWCICAKTVIFLDTASKCL